MSLKWCHSDPLGTSLVQLEGFCDQLVKKFLGPFGSKGLQLAIYFGMISTQFLEILTTWCWKLAPRPWFDGGKKGGFWGSSKGQVTPSENQVFQRQVKFSRVKSMWDVDTDLLTWFDFYHFLIILFLLSVISWFSLRSLSPYRNPPPPLSPGKI